MPSAFFLQFASACISGRSFLASVQVHAISKACLLTIHPPPLPTSGGCVMPWNKRVKSWCSPTVASISCTQGMCAILSRHVRLGDAMVVALNSDQSVRVLKGPDRPLNHQNDRAEVLAALRAVDAVVVFDDERATALIEGHSPACVCQRRRLHRRLFES
jgi:hypothetical protein